MDVYTHTHTHTHTLFLPGDSGRFSVPFPSANCDQKLLEIARIHTTEDRVKSLFDFWCEKWKSLSPIWLLVTPMDYIVHGILQARILE